jgi:hypothetical protein
VSKVLFVNSGGPTATRSRGSELGSPGARGHENAAGYINEQIVKWFNILFARLRSLLNRETVIGDMDEELA